MNTSTEASPRFLRESEVRYITGLSRAQRWRLERAGLFPLRVQLSERAYGWLEDEIKSWVLARVHERNQSPQQLAEMSPGNTAYA